MSKSLYSERHKQIAAAIAEQRRRKGMTQGDVAAAMSSTRYQSFVAKIESGERRVDLVELMRLADIIGLNLHDLIDRLNSIPDE
jgi:transcriptional regulator with XRE-family HTH domain